MLVTIPIQAVIEVSDDPNSYAQAKEAKAKIEFLLKQYNLVMVLTAQGIRVRNVIVEEPQPQVPQQAQVPPQYAATNGRR